MALQETSSQDILPVTAIDSGNYSVRIFFADFTKGFDIIDHSVLLDELKSFDIDQTLFFLGTLLSD